jgi:hypothetical protein
MLIKIIKLLTLVITGGFYEFVEDKMMFSGVVCPVVVAGICFSLPVDRKKSFKLSSPKYVNSL